MLGTLFRPPSTLYSLNVGLCFMMLSPRSMARLRKIPSIIAACALPVPVLLFIVTMNLWLVTGNGEANFVYFQCLAYNVFVVQIVVEFTGASLRRDKALRLTEKMMTIRNKTNEGEDDDGDRIPTSSRDNAGKVEVTE